MIQLVEMEGKMNEKGCIEVPAAVMGQTDIGIGETVKLIYLAERESLKNESKEFVIFRADQDVESGAVKEEDTTFQIPQELLKDAGIPMDADLEIVCQDQKIIIMPEKTVGEAELPKELLALCSELGIPENKVRVILRTTEEENAR